MITEKGGIKSSTPIDERAVKELNKSSFTLGIVYTVGGSIMIALWLILLVAETLEGTGESFTLLLCLGILFLFLGIIMITSRNKILKNSTMRKTVDEVEFFRDFMILREYVNGEHVSTSKIYYGWLVKVKETANYIFMYNTAATAVSVDKASLPPQELNAVRKLLGRPAIGASAPVQQADFNAMPADNGNARYNAATPDNSSQYSGGNADGGAAQTNPPADPFEDLAPPQKSAENDGDNQSDQN